MTRDAARDVEKVLRSAVANAEANHGLDGDELIVATAVIGEGPTLKRWRARARGRVGRIHKRTCHISITLSLPGGELIETPAAPPVAEPKPARAARKATDVPAAAEAAEESADGEETPKRGRARKQAEGADAPAVAEKPKRTRKAAAEKPVAEESSGSAPKKSRQKKSKESES
jgi:large subunit ribosomal protein L22